MRIVTVALFVLHGLIVAAQAGGSFSPGGGVANPNGLKWWPTSLGQSWLLSRLGLERSIFGSLAGVLWLVSGAAIIAAALGLFGFIVPTAWWRPLAGAGAILSLFLFAIYAHPFYGVGIGADVAILLVLLWAKWPSPAVLGS